MENEGMRLYKKNLRREEEMMEIHPLGIISVCDVFFIVLFFFNTLECACEYNSVLWGK